MEFNPKQDGAPMTLKELFAIYSRKRLRACSPHTTRLYNHSIKAFSETIGHEATTEDFTDENLEDHMWRLVECGLSVPTANKDYAQLSAMWRFAHRNRIVELWPNVVPLAEPERIPLGWLPDEVDRLFFAVSKLDGHIAGVQAGLWWRTLLELLFDTGERIGAVMKLGRTSIQGDYALVPSSIRKGKTRDKLYKLSQPTIIDLKLLLKSHQDPLIMPWDRSETYIYNRYSKILKSAGLNADSRSKFHRIRRTVASAVANQGGNATTAMDHANAKTTKRYLDPRIVKDTPTSDYVAAWRRSARLSEQSPNMKRFQETSQD